MFDLFQTKNLVAPHPQINLKPKEKQKINKNCGEPIARQDQPQCKIFGGRI